MGWLCGVPSWLWLASPAWCGCAASAVGSADIGSAAGAARLPYLACVLRSAGVGTTVAGGTLELELDDMGGGVGAK